MKRSRYRRETSDARCFDLKRWIFLALCGLAESAFAASGSAPFHFKVDMARTDLISSTLEARTGTTRDLIASKDKSSVLKITAKTKPLAAALNSFQLELFVENLQNHPLDNVTVHFEGLGSSVYDLTLDAYNTKALSADGKIPVGRLAPFGIKRIVLGLKKSFSPELTGDIAFSAGSGEGQTTTNILVTPDNTELWALSSDTGEVVVYGLPGKNELARIPVGAGAAGIALQKSRDWIVVSAAGANTLTIIDRRSKAVLNVLGQNSEYGPELQYVMVSQKSPVVYVSSYVEGILTRITLDENAHVTQTSTLPVGARPTGMSMTYDESYLYVAHFLPRGRVTDNESWISVINLANFTMENDGIIEDHFNPENPRMKCLADFYNNYPPAKLIYGSLSPQDMSFEGVASQLAGVFLDPSGQTAWVPGTRITGALVVLERGKDADPTLKRFGGIEPGQLSAPLIFPLAANAKNKLEPIYTRDVEMALPTLQGIVRCMRHPLEIEFIDRKMLGNGKEQINPFLAYGIPHAGLTGLGLVNTIQFSKGGRRVFLLSHISDEITVYDGVTIHPLSQRHLQLSGSNPKGMAVSPDFSDALTN
jgi:hypothetical protein